MDIVDVVRTLKSRKIYIPSHHQGPLFMKEGSSFTSVLLLGNHRDLHADGSKHWPQILISPFPLADWESLWRITFSIKDRNGILHEITKILQMGNLNIMTEVSRPVNLNQDQQVQMVVSSRETYKPLATMQRIKEHLVVNYFREFYIEQIDGVEPMPMMMDHLDKYQGLKQDYSREPGISFGLAHEQKVQVITAKRVGRFSLNRELFVEIPEKWREALQKVNGYHPGQKMTYLLHTNSSHQLLSIYFPPESTRLWNIRIECADMVGAIATFTRILKDEINLITTSLAKLDNYRSRVDLVCEFTKPREDDLGAVMIQAFDDSKEELLEFEPIVSTLGVLDSMSRTTRSEWKTIWNWRDKGQPQKTYGSHAAKTPDEDWTLDPNKEHDTDKERRDKLIQKLEEIYVELESENISEEEKDKLKRLKSIGEAMLSRGFLKEKRVFISCSFKKDAVHKIMTERMKQLFQDRQYEVLVGNNPPESDPTSEYLMQDIKRKIDKCPYFIAILTPDEERVNPSGGKTGVFYPSDWVIWEYGYAAKSARQTHVMLESSTQLPRLFHLLKTTEFSYLQLFEGDDTRIPIKEAFEQFDKKIKSIISSFEEDWGKEW